MTSAQTPLMHCTTIRTSTLRGFSHHYQSNNFKRISTFAIVLLNCCQQQSLGKFALLNACCCRLRGQCCRSKPA